MARLNNGPPHIYRTATDTNSVPLTRRQLANAIRALSMDAVERAQSGHPGAPLGMADIAEVLWNDYLRHNPLNPSWPDRDRFVLSNGHGCMLLYAALHLSGYELSMEQIKNFRQLGSMTPGHPEYGHTPGVEATTGPLGQGLACAVGMALAERSLAQRFNRDELELVNHHTYVAAGEGCLMEGISHEACSLAGVLGLGKLVVLFDNNNISIDGDVSGWFTEDTPARFEAYGWHVVRAVDGHDPEQIRTALDAARAEQSRPSLICFYTVIGWGAPDKEGTAACHGAPLGKDIVARTRARLGWSHPPFQLPREYYEHWDARERGARLEAAWRQQLSTCRARYPELTAEFERRIQGRLPGAWQAQLQQLLEQLAADRNDMATRKASLHCLEHLGPVLPELIGGSADLTDSNLTRWSGARSNPAEGKDGNYIYYGAREFAMYAINNGIALHGGWIPYGGTFLVFTDYARNALRLSALMGLRTIFVLTHDSIGLGEDGPTHQPVEQLASLRLIPEMSVWRPCDALECAVAWQAALEREDGPTALLLSRQTLPFMQRSAAQIDAIQRGAYVLYDSSTATPELILMATGSEVQLAMSAARQLESSMRVRVISMPCLDRFERQEASYREQVLPPDCQHRIATEAGSPDSWYRYTGSAGRVLGITRFGASAPGDKVYRHLGLTTEALVRQATELHDS